jgi:Protein of unknown function (DUF1320)
MIFLTPADYQTVITPQILQLINNDLLVFDQCEAFAKEQISMYIADRYDTVAIFSATGAARNALIVQYMVVIVLYLLHQRLAPNNIPEIRRHEYNGVISDLKYIAKGDASPPNLPPLTNGSNQPVARIKIGSNKKHDYDF